MFNKTLWRNPSHILSICFCTCYLLTSGLHWHTFDHKMHLYDKEIHDNNLGWDLVSTSLAHICMSMILTSLLTCLWVDCPTYEVRNDCTQTYHIYVLWHDIPQCVVKKIVVLSIVFYFSWGHSWLGYYFWVSNG